MAADGFTAKLEGIDDLRRALAEAGVAIRTRAVRGALRKGAQVIARPARQAAPVLKAPTKYRVPGTVRKAIVVRASKFARSAGDEGVYIGVRALKGVRRRKLGADAGRNDPYYWRWLEFGTRKMRPRPFLRPAVESHGQTAVKTVIDNIVPQIERLNRRAGNVR